LAEGKQFEGINGIWLPRRWKGTYPSVYSTEIPANAIYSLTEPTGEFVEGDIWVQSSKYEKDSIVYLYRTGM
jgi:hypothetical protein